MLVFIAIATFTLPLTSPPLPNHPQPQESTNLFSVYNSVIPRMLHKWNHMVCHLFELALPPPLPHPPYNSLRLLSVSGVFSILLAGSIPRYPCTIVRLTIQLLKDSLLLLGRHFQLLFLPIFLQSHSLSPHLLGLQR